MDDGIIEYTDSEPSIQPPMLGKLGGYQQSADEFRKQVEEMHKGLPQMERIEALLVDILCVLNMEFYVRPKE